MPRFTGVPTGSFTVPIPHQAEAEAFVKANKITTRAAWGAQATKLDATKADNLDWDYNTLVIHHSGRSGEDDPQKV